MYQKYEQYSPALECLGIRIPCKKRLPEFRAGFDRTLKLLLQGSPRTRNLNKMRICGKSSRILSLLQSSPSTLRLNKLSEILVFRDDDIEHEFCSLLRGIDFDRFFPCLKSIVLSHKDDNFHDVDEDEDDSSDDDTEEADVIPPTVSYSSSTVTHLELKSVVYRTISFNQLKQAFPALTSLCLKSLSADNVVTLWQIIRLWPGLEEIHLKGQTKGIWRNFDSEFCGTSREEMAYLWEQDEEFLSKIHVVPIRPCLSTLSSFLRVTKPYAKQERASLANKGPSIPECNSVGVNIFVAFVHGLVYFCCRGAGK